MKNKESEYSNFTDHHFRKNKSKTPTRSQKGNRKLKRPEGNNFYLTYQEYFPESNTNQAEPKSFQNRTKGRRHTFNSMKFLKNDSFSSGSKESQVSLKQKVDQLNEKLKRRQKELVNNKRNHTNEVKERELMELCRVISFYEGKIKKMEEQLKQYEQQFQSIGLKCDQQSSHKSQIAKLVQLFEEMRHDNEELSAKVQQKDFQMGKLNKKIKKLMSDNRFISKKPLVIKKEKYQIGVSGSKSGISQRTFHSVNPIPSKKNMYGNIQSKINRIEGSLNFFKKENDKLFEEIEEKNQKIDSLEQQLLALKEKLPSVGEKSKISQNKDSSVKQKKQENSKLKKGIQRDDPLNKVVVLNKNMLRQIDNPRKQQIPVSEKKQPTNPFFNNQLRKLEGEIRNQIIRKLKYQLITEQVEFDELIDTLLSEDNEVEFFEEYPYNLLEQQAEWLCSWIEKIRENSENRETMKKYLKSVIPKYETLTLRTENNIKIQLYNSYLNREEELQKQIEQNGNQRNFEEMLDYFKKWPVTEKHIDILGKNIYEETGKIHKASLKNIEQLFIKWGNL